MTKTIEQLEAELQATIAAIAAKGDAERSQREAQTAAWRALSSDPTSWEWHARPEERQGFIGDPQTSGLRISARIKPALLEKWRKGGLPLTSTDAQEGRWLGMFYWRTDEGILTHKSGGHMILRDPVLCSDEQWAALEQGDVPRKWQRVTSWL